MFFKSMSTKTHTSWTNLFAFHSFAVLPSSIYTIFDILIMLITKLLIISSLRPHTPSHLVMVLHYHQLHCNNQYMLVYVEQPNY